MARFDARLVQTLLGALAIICGGVVLGISAHVEHSTRTLGVKTSTYTFAAFVGAFTILAQVVMIITRYAAPKKAVSYVVTELGISALQWIFWLATTIDVTKLTSEDRSVCRNLNDIFRDPVFNGFDPAAIDVVKKIFKEACRELKAELAFLWIGLITVTISVIYMLAIAFQIKRRNTTTLKAAMTTPLSQHDHTFDPFRDPEGSAPRASVGVPQDPNEPIYKP